MNIFISLKVILKYVIFFWIGAAIFLLTGCDFIYGLIDKEGAQEKRLIGDIVSFEQNMTVKEIQILLDIYGYNPGKPDGIFGAKTRSAIGKFQMDIGVKVSRFVDEETWKRLTIFKEQQLILNNKVNTRLIQEILMTIGYAPGTVDGKYGPQTKKAVMQFQQDADLKPDGKIGYKTLTRLSEYIMVE